MIQIDHKRKLPNFIVYTTILICIGPFILNLCGLDFGSLKTKLDPELLSLPKSQMADALFYKLRGAFTHALLEWSAFAVAIFCYVLSLVHFTIKKNPATPIIGLAIFCAGCVDAFHTLAAARLIESVAENSNLIPFTWAISRVFNAVILIIGCSLIIQQQKNGKKWGSHFSMLRNSLLLVFLSYVVIFIK